MSSGADRLDVLITEPCLRVSPAELSGKERDTLRLAWEERRWTRKRVMTTGGRAVGLALPTGTVLRPGDIIAIEPGWYLAVDACPEPVLVVTPRSAEEAIRIAFDVGNRHFPLAIEGDVLLVPDDSAMTQLLDRRGVAWERREAVFDPIAGAHRHGHGESPLDGHRHGATPHTHD